MKKSINSISREMVRELREDLYKRIWNEIRITSQKLDNLVIDTKDMVEIFSVPISSAIISIALFLKDVTKNQLDIATFVGYTNICMGQILFDKEK